MTKKQVKLKLESLIHLIRGKNTPPFSPSIEEDFDYLRLCIVDLKFDNEATKRELRTAIGKR